MNRDLNNKPGACRRLHPEDLQPGTFVAVLGMVHEVYPPWSLESPDLLPPRPIRLVCMGCADGEPLRILAVCLPFVQAEDAAGELRTLDVRQHQLASVPEDYALEVFTRPSRVQP